MRLGGGGQRLAVGLGERGVDLAREGDAEAHAAARGVAHGVEAGVVGRIGDRDQESSDTVGGSTFFSGKKDQKSRRASSIDRRVQAVGSAVSAHRIAWLSLWPPQTDL